MIIIIFFSKTQFMIIITFFGGDMQIIAIELSLIFYVYNIDLIDVSLIFFSIYVMYPLIS